MWSSIFTLALASPASSATVVLDGIYSSFKTGGSPNDVVDRALFKMRDETHVELYRNGEVGQTTPILADSVHLSQSFDFHDGVLSGCDGCDGVTGTVQANGDIVWTHGYTSRKDAPDISGVYYSFATGGSPSSVVDRFEARQAGNHVTFYRNGAVGQTTPILSATATAGESYTVEGNTLSGAVTGTVNSNGDIVWSHGYTSRKQSSAGAPPSQSCEASHHEVRHARRCLAASAPPLPAAANRRPRPAGLQMHGRRLLRVHARPQRIQQQGRLQGRVHFRLGRAGLVPSIPRASASREHAVLPS